MGKEKKLKLNNCIHEWGELKKTIVKPKQYDVYEIVDFYYQKCRKCGLINRI